MSVKMETDEDYPFDGSGIVDFGIASFEDDGLVGTDDLVEYSAGEDETEEEALYIKREDEAIPRTIINSSNITVKRIVSSKPAETNVQRVAPKPTSLIRTNNNGGKVVLVQKSSTSTSGAAPVKLLNSAQTMPTAGNTTSYQLVKSEGNVVMRPKATMIRRIVSSTESPDGSSRAKTMVKAPTHVVIHTKSGTSGSTTKTVTVAEAHRMGLLDNKVKQVVAVSKANASGPPASKSPAKVVAGSGGTAASTVVRLKQSPGAPGTAGPTQKVLIKATPTIAGKTAVHSQKVVLSQSAFQAGQQSGQIQAINIPGKGIQYVRFLNQQPSSSTPTGSVQKVVQVHMNKGTPPPGSKVIVQNNKTYVVSNGNVPTVRAAASQHTRTLSSDTQPILRKTVIPANQVGGTRKESETHYIAVVKKDNGQCAETVTTLTASQLSQLKGTSTLPSGATKKIVMVSSEYSRPAKGTSSSSASSSASLSNPPAIIAVKRESVSGSEEDTRKGPAVGTIFPDEAYKKRPCNCTRSQCLKLYCDCFANGEFCYNCNCRDCYNNLDNEEERHKAIRATLERNPMAFKPKIGAVSADEDALRQHTKGCNCKRSGCLKNYCECYEAKIPCSGNCKCIGCRNTEQYAKEYEYATGVPVAGGATASAAMNATAELDAETAGDTSLQQSSGDNATLDDSVDLAVPGPSSSSMGDCGGSLAGTKRSLASEPDLTQLPPSKQPYNFMTPDVIEATVQCMIAQADECQKRGCNIRTAERMILEEFGRCLVEIIDFSTKSDS